MRGRRVTRPLSYGDVAILCRASTSFAAYEDALERAGIPFLTVPGRGFYGRPEIRDLLNALSALADPTDDLALAGLLRSPVCALSDAALTGCATAPAGRRGAARRLAVGRAARPAGAAGAARLALPARRRSPARFFAGGRHRRAGGAAHRRAARPGRARHRRRRAQGAARRHRLPGRLPPGRPSRATRNVAKLLADAHASGMVSVGEFLEYVGDLRDVGARNGEAHAAVEGAVQIMSVHAAKGLEFPVVVIGDASYSAKRRSGLLIDPRLGVVPPVKDQAGAGSALYAAAQTLAEDRSGAEEDRLLYVAATRAREKLILSGCLAGGDGGRPPRPRGWLERLCTSGDLLDDDAVAAYDPNGAAARVVSHEISRKTQNGLENVVGGWVYEPGWTWQTSEVPKTSEVFTEVCPTSLPPLMAPLDGRDGAVEAAEPDGEATEERVWRVVPATPHASAPHRVIGLLVHAALAQWRLPDAGFERWAVARARSLRPDGCRPTAGRRAPDALAAASDWRCTRCTARWMPPISGCTRCPTRSWSTVASRAGVSTPSIAAATSGRWSSSRPTACATRPTSTSCLNARITWRRRAATPPPWNGWWAAARAWCCACWTTPAACACGRTSAERMRRRSDQRTCQLLAQINRHTDVGYALQCGLGQQQALAQPSHHSLRRVVVPIG